MANLKLDLVNKVNNEKYYEEIEFIRLAQEPNMNYAQKIQQMQDALENIAVLNALPSLVEHYLPEPKAQEPVAAPKEEAPAKPAAKEAPAKPAAHPGQSHAE